MKLPENVPCGTVRPPTNPNYPAARFSSPQHTVEFAKRIPGFNNLTQEDQLILIKGNFVEVWLIRIARLVDGVNGTLTLPEGTRITKVQLLVMMVDEEIVKHIFDLAQRCGVD